VVIRYKPQLSSIVALLKNYKPYFPIYPKDRVYYQKYTQILFYSPSINRVRSDIIPTPAIPYRVK